MGRVGLSVAGVWSVGFEMSKRPASDDGLPSKKAPGFWANGLLTAMKDPTLIVKEDSIVVVIKDKYPKAEFHYLVLPKEDIHSLTNVTRANLPLLKHMDKIAQEITRNHEERQFKIGYHAVASMARLHLHVISDDFNSPSLKTKKHWNTFTTDFFVPSAKVLAEVEEHGKFTRISSEVAKKLMDTPLKCNKCSFQSPTIPKLKQHLLTHIMNK
ncbi:aprataxin [Schistocerca nitens]|uniref:aprataxin n=1 Tax=Schistocerca nitens TaxID=7011 RepID=UPI002118EF6F|nr:aprataxin [Schistocerca nitens]